MIGLNEKKIDCFGKHSCKLYIIKDNDDNSLQFLYLIYLNIVGK